MISCREERGASPCRTPAGYEVVYVRRGEGVLTLQGREYPLQPGSLAFPGLCDDYALRPLHGECTRCCLCIPPAHLRAFQGSVTLLSVFRLRGPDFPHVVHAGEAQPRMDGWFDLLLETCRSGGPCSGERLDALVTLVLTEAQAICPALFTPADARSFLPVEEILHELDAHFSEKFSLAELARRHHVSPGCLSAHFRRQVGMSPMQYVTQRRMRHACELLAHTSLSVARIAAQCGCGDASGFVRRFRRQYGQTPLQFRTCARADAPAPEEKA